MHGIIFTALKKYVKTRLGAGAWDQLREAAGLGGRLYLPVQPYPDEEILTLVTTASRITGIPAPDLLEDYGKFIVPDLLAIYRGVIDPTWRTLDLIDHVENTIHRVVRLNNPGATPPELTCVRMAPDRLLIRYDSPRKLCSVGKGLVRGVAEYYGDTISIQETSCMLHGQPSCTILVTLESARDGVPAGQVASGGSASAPSAAPTAPSAHASSATGDAAAPMTEAPGRFADPR